MTNAQTLLQLPLVIGTFRQPKHSSMERWLLEEYLRCPQGPLLLLLNHVVLYRYLCKRFRPALEYTRRTTSRSGFIYTYHTHQSSCFRKKSPRLALISSLVVCSIFLLRAFFFALASSCFLASSRTFEAKLLITKYRPSTATKA